MDLDGHNYVKLMEPDLMENSYISFFGQEALKIAKH